MAQYLGHYEVIRELGAGHFGTVYLANGEVPGKGVSGPRRRLVAIKRLRNPGDPGAFETLVREFDLLDQVKHRSLCKVYEFLEDERAVVMEHVHGLTLREVLEACTAAREKVFVEAAIEIGCEVADCLYQAYATPGRNGEPLQLVHRDLKPENVMITPTGEVKVLDFGLARVDPTHRADDRRIKGTPLYMAPEQALGKVVDHRTDLFALGLVLFELLMERPAYQVPESGRDPVAEVMRRIERADLDKEIHDIESRLPGPGPVVARCLQGNQRARYQNGHELMLDLRRQLLKDRGAYLREFCDYFFHNVRPLEPVASEPGAPGKVRGGGPSRPSTPEQGRAEPMANNPTPPRPGAPPRPGMPGTPPRPAAGPPRPGGPVGAPPGIAPPGPPAAAGPPGRPPAAPAAPARPIPQGGKGVFVPPGSGRNAAGLSDTPMAPKKKKKGADPKSPDETGMLQMHALKDDDDDEADLTGAAPKSATQFFAIPATKKKSRSDDAPAGGGPPKVEGTSGRALPGSPGAGMAALPGLPPPGSPGSMPPMQMGGMPGMAPGMGAPMAIQGPVAAGAVAAGAGMAAAPGTPFAVGGPQPMGGVPPEENRAQSYRVFAIVLALVGIAMMVTLLAVVAILVGLNMGEDPPKEEVAKVVETPSRPSKPIRDTGEEEKAPEPKKVPKKTSSAPKPPPPPKEPEPPPPAALAPVTITVPASEPFTSVEIKCSAARQRATFSGGKATVPDVPTAEDCQAFFKGGAPATYRPVSGGMNLSCTFVSSTAVCK